MKAESVIFAVSGAVFGLLVGWMLGVQQAERVTPAPSAAAAAQGGAAAQGQGGGSPAAASGQGGGAASATPLDTARVQALEARAAEAPNDAAVRAELGNLYFDAERFADAARWYEAALAIAPDNPDVSTDLGICYYYMNQAPRAIEQFEASLKADPRHTKTLLNLGIVKAFGTQDLKGAAAAWQQVVAIAPADSPEARAARQALEGLRSAHPDLVPDPPAAPQGT
jgi:tetratricopeptide (TPR) repeat protein